MLSTKKNTKQQGNVGVGQAIAYFTKLGHVVLLPLNDSQEYDLVVDQDGELKKVQVKTTYHRVPSGNFSVELRTSGGNQSYSTVKHFDSCKVDYLFILTEDEDKYLIPCSDIDNKSTITLGDKFSKFRV